MHFVTKNALENTLRTSVKIDDRIGLKKKELFISKLKVIPRSKSKSNSGYLHKISVFHIIK